MLKGKLKTPKPVILLIIAFLCPTEFSLYIAGLRIPPHRLALILLFPLALWRFAAQKNLKIRSFDIVFLLFNIWTVGIFTYHHGDHEGLIYGGSLALDGMGAYLVARVWIRSIENLQATLKTLGIAIAFAALIALPETLFGHIFTHDALKALTGYAHPTAEETRMHLTRAYGTFDHPIHYGTFCAALLSLFWYAANSAKERRKRAMLLTAATFLGLSSAPMLCLALQAAMLAWEKATRGTANRTSMTLAVFAGLYVGASCVMTRSPIDFIATGMTLDAWTGFYRLQIWEHGLANVYVNPWAGIGLGDWDRPWWMASTTIDAFWLVICLREGIPAFLLIATAIILNLRAVTKTGLRGPDIRVRRLARGWIMSLIALCLVGVTVHYWNVLYAFFFFFMGLSGWIADPVKAGAAVKAKVLQRRPLPAPPVVQQQRPAYAGGFGNGPLPVPY